MRLTEIILLAMALGIDCLIVSKNSILLASTMGIFQGGMPIISYFATGFVSGYLETYANWIVCLIFMFLGCKFFFEASETKDDCKICCIDFKCLILIGIATSIDALGAGVGLKLTSSNIIIGSLIIGLASFVMSLTGFWIGNRFKNLPTEYLEICGGLILIVLAIKAIF